VAWLNSFRAAQLLTVTRRFEPVFHPRAAQHDFGHVPEMEGRLEAFFCEVDVNHHKHSDTIEKLLGSEWGGEYSTSDDAIRAMLCSPQFSGHAILTLVSRLDEIVRSLAMPAMKRLLQETESKADVEVQRFFHEREHAHGPCPESVKYWVNERKAAAIGWHFQNWRPGCGPYLNLWRLPAKGTATRKDYDAWMRRKAQTVAK
jgi:hypothetical protein